VQAFPSISFEVELNLRKKLHFAGIPALRELSLQKACISAGICYSNLQPSANRSQFVQSTLYVSIR